jgi:hypothetical protein
MSSRQPWLREWTATAPRLLRVRQSADAAALRLEFDQVELQLRAVGDRLWLSAGAPEPLALAEPLEEAGELDPWWAVLGAPLLEAWAEVDSGGAVRELDLQLREDDQNPKMICLTLGGGRLRATALPKAQWSARLGH